MDPIEAEFAAHCKSRGKPERIELLLVDINGCLRGKWMPGDTIDKLAKNGVRLPVSSYTLDINGEEVEASGYGVTEGDPDGYVKAFAGTISPVSWANVPTAQMLVEIQGKDGKPLSLDPRRRLMDMQARFQAKGLTPVAATELEFYLIRSRAERADPPMPPDTAPMAHAYDMDVVDGKEAFLQAVLDGCKAQGLPSDTVIAEFGPGQFEINFHHTDDVVAAADYAVLFRRLVKSVARRHGFDATFMAKPYAHTVGSGMHVHVSLLDEKGANVMSGQKGQLAPVLAHSVGGLLQSMPQMQAVFAPHYNSYRRFQPNSFAPSSPNWGFDHRGASVRLPETTGPGARLEHRISGADVNPYLALTAILGGMLHGIENEIDPGLPLDDPKAETAKPLFSAWEYALAAFEASPLSADFFGEEFARVYVAICQQELEFMESRVSPLEYETYLARL